MCECECVRGREGEGEGGRERGERERERERKRPVFRSQLLQDAGRCTHSPCFYQLQDDPPTQYIVYAGRVQYSLKHTCKVQLP